MNTQTEKKRDRRALTHDEQNRLIETALKSDAKYQGLTGNERAMLYLLAAETGFRANELGTLSWKSFDFDKSGPTVTVTAAYSKGRKEKVQPIRSDVAERFQIYTLGGYAQRGSGSCRNPLS
jgi:integrase